MEPHGPLAATLERLAGVDPWFGADVGVPVGESWFRFETLDADGLLAEWVDEVATRHGGRRDVAGSYLGGWLAGAATIVPTAALILEGRVPDPASALWVRRHADGWIDRVAFDGPGLLVAGGDPATGHPDATVVDGTALLATYGSGLVARLTPLLDAVRALAPFGRRGLWGAVADEIASAALWAAREGGGDLDAAWRTAGALIDVVAEEASWIRARPRPFPVVSPAGQTLFSVKGTCCLYYKTQPQPPDPCGESYCTTCPFRDETSRHERLVAHLAAES